MTGDELRDLTLAFTEAFNRDDLDAVMGYFAEDAVYNEFNCKESRGKAAIREAFEPQFRGDFGTIRFETEDVFADGEAGRSMVSWACRSTRDGKSRCVAGPGCAAFPRRDDRGEGNLCKGRDGR
jgi:ketosteroid isomerase-like protein